MSRRAALVLRFVSALAVVGVLVGALVGPPGAVPASASVAADASAAVANEAVHDTSPPLIELPLIGPTPKFRNPGSTKPRIPYERQAVMYPDEPAAVSGIAAMDEVNLTSMPAPSQNFAGVDNPNGYFPPDTVGDVGPNHYVLMVNVSFAVYTKTGVKLYGPVDFQTVFGGFPGACGTENSGDPIVVYDGLADRWVLSQFAIPAVGDMYECVAVSATADPLGAYHRYAFSYGAMMPDYPKLSVWPDGYYASYNMYNPSGWAFTGAKVCALERSKMLVGEPATQQCVDVPEAMSLLPADVDGPNPPPAGSPNYVMGEHWSDTDKLTLRRFFTDWENPANTHLDGPVNLAVLPWSRSCVGGEWYCVDQPQVNRFDAAIRAPVLDTLDGTLMYRLAYRNFGTHESLLANHTVGVDVVPPLHRRTGIAWYEIRSPGQTPVVYQEGTSAAPTPGEGEVAPFRWMGSIAMDREGNVALGYSSSSSTRYPSINYVGRLATDPLGTMSADEGVIMAGAGSQTATPARWGDYSAMQVDPDDDCTFWYTNEYLRESTPASWSTQIASFRFPGCEGSTTRPGAPASVTPAASNTEVAVSWTPPVDGGGLPVTGYSVVAAPDGAACATLVGVTADPLACTVAGLANGTAYTFAVTATNAKGISPAAVSAPATPADVPSAPLAVSAVAGSGRATVSWMAPASTGGSPITEYTATAMPGGATCSSSRRPGPGTADCVITGLSNGTAYTFTVVATNVMGSSVPSAPSTPVSPAAPSAGPGPAPGPTSTPASTPAAPPTAAPGPDAPPQAPASTLRLSTGRSTTFEPASRVPVRISGGVPGCTVLVTVGRSSRTAVIDPAGAAGVTVTAPRPNRRYDVTARQGGAGCPAVTARRTITVSGPYVLGPTRADAGVRLVFRGRGLRPGAEVTWRVTRGGEVVAEATRTASADGTSTFSASLPTAGAYAVSAGQGRNRAEHRVYVT